jgi:hypothetical protein
MRERGIGERPDRDRHRVRPALGRPEHRCATVRAEAKRPLLASVRDADVFRRASGDLDPILWPPRLHPKRAASPTLASEAVTHRDPHRIALCRHPELAAAGIDVLGCPGRASSRSRYTAHSHFPRPRLQSAHGSLRWISTRRSRMLAVCSTASASVACAWLSSALTRASSRPSPPTASLARRPTRRSSTWPACSKASA